MKQVMEIDNYSGKLQHPIGSGFNAESTAEQVIRGIDLTGKVVIVTGGGAGIGLETTRVIAGAGATVVVGARDINKAATNLRDIPNVEVLALDLIDPKSIDAFAEQFLSTARSLHILINNAGIMWVPLRRDDRGIESQLATNYLGQFHLTSKLWPALANADGARVVNLSSFGHQMAPFNFKDPNFANRPYETLEAYGQSKTATNLFSLELDSRGKASGVRSYAVHPGAINGTELGREAPVGLFEKMGYTDAAGNVLPEVAAQLKTVPQGAATTTWCATSPMLNNIGGVYCEDSDIAELDRGSLKHVHTDHSTLRMVQPYSLDKGFAEQLWTLSEEMAGIAFLSGESAI